MAITDELRSVAAKTECANGRCEKLYRGDLETIADNIDAEHTKAQRRWMAELDAAREQSFNAGFDDGFASADDWLAQHEDAMREHGWVKLPKDADGEYIYIGDVVEFSRFEIDCPVTREVDGIGQGVFFAWCGERGYEQLNADSYRRHHKQPTVEDVLTDLCEHVWESALLGSTWSDSPVESYITEYAAKMRLAESEDE